VRRVGRHTLSLLIEQLADRSWPTVVQEEGVRLVETVQGTKYHQLQMGHSPSYLTTPKGYFHASKHSSKIFLKADFGTVEME
jgi:hypothetical protein